MQRIRVLDPTAPPPELLDDPGPPAASLAGARVGIRYDRTWQSFLHVIDEWQPRLREAGASLQPWEAKGRVGEEGERTRRELADFVEGIDVAIVGLGN